MNTHTDTGATDYDTTSAVGVVMVKAGSLKDGMVLCDPELHTPAMIVDHKVRGSHGDAALYVLDLEAKGYATIRIAARVLVPVMAA